MTAEAEARERHRAFLNAYYGATRGVYDATRRYYLLGRDRAIRDLLDEPWTRLVEVGPGTGRNLARLRDGRPSARFGGVDACDAMLEVARERCPWARLVAGFAEEVDYAAVLDMRPDRILFSYALSMFADPGAALDRARRALAPRGKVVAVDFGDFGGLPRPIPALLRAWLAAFHVRPLDLASCGAGADRRYGPGRYYAIATFDPEDRTNDGGDIS